MPAPGDQHHLVANPFEESRPKISGYTAEEIALLQHRLEKKLGPEYISARAGPSGQKVHYIAAEKCISLANEVFGFNGWSSSIQNIQVDFVDENPQTLKISLGISVVVRVTLRDGTYHEDIGYGHMENCKGKAAAFEKAKKEATTDALKRALRNFGNVLGNCIYDKDYLGKVTKIKAGPGRKFDVDDLHRHTDFAPKQEPKIVAKEPKEVKEAKEPEKLQPHASSDSFEDLLGGMDEFDEADFCVAGEGHPDEVSLTSTTSTNNSNGRPAQPPQAAPNGRPAGQPLNGRQPQTPLQPPRPASVGPAQQMQQHRPGQGPAPAQQPNNQAPRAASAGEPVAFFSAKAFNQLPEDAVRQKEGEADTPLLMPQAQQVFNPKAESPSIRKTPGVDHTSSKPLSRNGQHVPPAARPESGPPTGAVPQARPHGLPHQRGNVVNPQFDQTRRIGAPGGMHSPHSNRQQYKPLTVKRPLPEQNNAAKVPLADISTNNVVGGQAADSAKRQKLA